MNPSLRDRFERLALRLAELDATLSDPDVAADAQRYRALLREQAEVQGIVTRWQRYRQREADIAAARELLAGDDAEMAAMAAEEIAGAEAEMQRLQAELQTALLPKDPDDERNHATRPHHRHGHGDGETPVARGPSPARGAAAHGRPHDPGW